MKHMWKRVLSLAMALMLIMSLSLPVLADDTDNTVRPYSDTQTVYMTAKGKSTVTVNLAYGETNFTIKRADVKVTAGSAGGKLIRLSKSAYTNSYADEYNWSGNEEWESYQDDWSDYDYTATLQVKKAGTTTVSYKIGDQTYTTKVKVVAYKNPVKTITLKGVNKGKNFASLTKSSIEPSKNLKLSSNAKSAALKIVPTKGWKISNASMTDETMGITRQIRNYPNPMSSAKISWGTLYASHTYHISVRFVNPSTGASMYINYPIN